MGVKVAKRGHRMTVSDGGDAEAAGLGDAVEAVAKPIGNLFGLKNCAGCQRRKASLNVVGRRASTRIRNLFRRR